MIDRKAILPYSILNPLFSAHPLLHFIAEFLSDFSG